MERHFENNHPRPDDYISSNLAQASQTKKRPICGLVRENGIVFWIRAVMLLQLEKVGNKQVQRLYIYVRERELPYT